MLPAERQRLRITGAVVILSLLLLRSGHSLGVSYTVVRQPRTARLHALNEEEYALDGSGRPRDIRDLNKQVLL